MTTSTEKLGKPAGSDESAQKNTFPKLVGLNQAKAMADDLLSEALHALHSANLQSARLEALARMVVERDH